MLKDYEFWFVVGSQFLYGPKVLQTVADRAAEMAQQMNAGGKLPCRIVYKVTAKTNAEITELVRQANYDERCAGIITWCHTFSPSKMWINGLTALQKPYCHLATQYGEAIPNEEIDMDFMNLNQSAHGDREHGFIAARLRMPRKVIAGFWQDENVQTRLGEWMRAAVGVAVSKGLKVMRFGDNMREVAVTEGDKVEAQARLGYSVNGYGIGDLVKCVEAVTDRQIKRLCADYDERYRMVPALRPNGEKRAALVEAARIEAGLRAFLESGGFAGFTDTFEDLGGLRQLPGLAVQRLMADGYGYGAEG
ncbi:MAG: L-arabinose isomerase, partial [Eubacteriales bacterium]|nr:L-arabinose isomerase [Eubacteriales bacterium]